MEQLTPRRERLVSWEDPLTTAAGVAGRTGLAFMQAIATGEVPAPPIARLMGFGVAAVREGEVVFTGEPDESVYNPIGAVHGGYVATLLDSALGCAVHTTLPAGTGYTSIDLKVSFLRAVRAGGGPLRATGRVVKPGRRVAFAEAVLEDAEGRALATGQSSLLILAG